MQSPLYRIEYLALLVLCMLTQACAAPPSRPRQASGRGIAESKGQLPGVRVTVLRQHGGRVAWSAANNLIAFDKLGEDGFYDIYVMNPDGSGERCLTDNPQLGIPQKHNGNPSWHPSGNYLVFQAEKDQHPGSSRQSTPGFGLHTDLWIVATDGSWVHQLTHKKAGKSQGTLHPHFSHDGRYLTWSEFYEPGNPLVPKKTFGFWKLSIADYAMGPGGPSLTNIREFEPGGPAFYENHGLTHDNQTWLFTSNCHAKFLEILNNDVYCMDLKGKEAKRLTDDRYNEHAHYSPNGRRILWMSGSGNENRGTDFWVMNLDGSGKTRLTDFNHPGSPLDNRGKPMVCADSDWSPDGKQIVGYVQTDLIKQVGLIVLIDLSPEIAKAAAQ